VGNVSQATRRGGIAPAPPLASATLFSLATSATAWPAAGYGALVIWAAGDFASTGTLWIFGWPFLIELLAGTTLHLLAVGAAARWGIPPLIPGINAFEPVLRGRPDGAPWDEAALRAALRAIERFPIWNELIGLGLAALVAATTAVLERLAAGADSPNVWVIVRGGVYALALYGVASLALGELLARPACRALRRTAAGLGIEPYGGLTLPRAWRIAAMVVPTLVALLVAVEIGHSARGGPLAYAALIGLSATVAVALNMLQYENARSAVRELRDACHDLAAGHEVGLVTGSIEPMVVELAGEFTAAARRVGAHRRDSGERYRAVFEAALDCIITMDAEGRIVEFNPAAERTFGRSHAEVVGKPLAETIVPPSLRDGHVAGLARYLGTGESRMLGRRLELRAMRADGSEFPAEIAVARIDRAGVPMFTAHLRDITARKEADDALSASKREAEEQAEIVAALLEVEETINAHLNRPDLLEQVSRLTVAALGCDTASILVRDRDREIFRIRANAGSSPDVVPELQQIEFTVAGFGFIRTLESGRLLEIADAGTSGLLPPGLAERWRLAALLAAPITCNDEIVGIIAATYREEGGSFTAKQHRLALGVAHATAIALENARLIADLRAASRMKTEFVSTMSHELRTPLNVILGFCEMARDPAIDDRDRAVCHERIEVAGRTLLELVEGTLEVGKLEAGREDLELEVVDLTALWDKLGHEHAVLPRDRPVVIEWSPSVPDVVVLADQRKLAMVVRNLVGNALKFTDEGVVRAEMAVDGEQVVLRIADSGIGIAPEDQERVFGMFCQADGSDSRRHGGTGLGLYIVRRFVEQLGGRIELESILGSGSTFTVWLPRAKPAAAEANGPEAGGRRVSRGSPVPAAATVARS
jgi:PAS domain S-box-containing protein